MSVHVGEYRIFRPDIRLIRRRIQDRDGDAVTIEEISNTAFKIRSVRDGWQGWAVEHELKEMDAEETERYYGLIPHWGS